MQQGHALSAFEKHRGPAGCGVNILFPGLSGKLPLLRWAAMSRLSVIFWVCVLAFPAWSAEKVFDFSAEPTNQPPRGFRSTLLGTGQPGDWRIVWDELPGLFNPVSPRSPVANKQRVLAQLSADQTEERYPMLVYEGEAFEDFTFTTSFKIVDGKTEQMAGVAFRIQDEKNYYYVRASALGTNIAFLKVANGQLVARTSANADIQMGKWYDLTLECKGLQVRALLNGREVLLVTDTSGQAAFSKGKVGFWTKADSVSHFAHARITYTPHEPLAQTLLNEVLKKYPRLVGLKIVAPSNTNSAPRVLASHDPQEVGQPASAAESDVIAKGVIYYGKEKGVALVTLPLRDKNGDTIAAVRVAMKSFAGQTEQNAVARATPIIKQMELRVPTIRDLVD